MLALTLNQISAQADMKRNLFTRCITSHEIDPQLIQAYCMSLLKKAFKCSYSLCRKENTLILYIKKITHLLII